MTPFKGAQKAIYLFLFIFGPYLSSTTTGSDGLTNPDKVGAINENNNHQISASDESASRRLLTYSSRGAHNSYSSKSSGSASKSQAYTGPYVETYENYDRYNLKVRFLDNKHFHQGTYRIVEPNCRYVLQENILFNPRSNYKYSPNQEGAYFPLQEQAYVYPGSDREPGSFRLGFFAILSIEASNIILDLNGFEMAYHPEFAMQQRFGSLIEVGKGPFIDGQGPSQFGADFEVENIVIRNGKLGLTSHHGIHGNRVSNVQIHDLRIYDFEVAAIQLNGFDNAEIYNCDIGPSLTSVPVVGRYSQARFGMLSYNSLASGSNSEQEVDFTDREDSLTAREIVDSLRLGMDLFFDWKMSGSSKTWNYDLLDKNPHEDRVRANKIFESAMRIFDNPSGLPDGSALYGIILSSDGVAVDWFGTELSDPSDPRMSKNAYLSNIVIHDLNVQPMEVIALENENGVHTTGPYKGVLPMDLLLDTDSVQGREGLTPDQCLELSYHGNILSDAQVALAMYGEEGQFELAGTTITEEFIDWATLGVEMGYTLNKSRLVANGDDMFHMNKGAVGIRVDNTENVYMSNIKIESVHNWGEFGTELCDDTAENASYVYQTHPKTPSDAEDHRYQGTMARGVSLTNLLGNNVLKDIEINAVTSSRGSARGIDVLTTLAANVSGDVTINILGGLYIDNIEAGTCLDVYEKSELVADPVPNGVVEACGVKLTNKNASCVVSGTDNVNYKPPTDLRGSYKGRGVLLYPYQFKRGNGVYLGHIDGVTECDEIF